MADISQPPSQSIISGQDLHDATGSRIYSASPRRTLPEPNPHFVFPPPPPEPIQEFDATKPDANSKRRSANRIRPQNLSISSPPPFTFPSSNTPPTGEYIDYSPSRPVTIGSRPGGHRRGGSEFIGGDGSVAGPGLMSSSPTKWENALPSPPVSGRRRGHAHRRSGAISSHDLSTMLKQPTDSRGLRTGSAPTTPCDPNFQKPLVPTLDRSASQPSLSNQPPSTDVCSSQDKNSPDVVVPLSRPRVGFSDTLEFIPRPLSTISSATSSTLSTVRQSHSLTGSVTSVRSSGTASPPAKRSSTCSDLAYEILDERTRPKTADPVSTYSWKQMLPRPSTPPFRSYAALRTTNFDSKNLVVSPNSQRGDYELKDPQQSTEQQSSSPAPNIIPKFTAFPSDDQKLLSTTDQHLDLPQRPKSSPEGKVYKRQRKVKSWAGLLSRKGKQRVSDEPVPPLPSFNRQSDGQNLGETALLDESALDDFNFDENTTCILRPLGQDAPRSAPVPHTLAWSPKSPDIDSGSVLDIDLELTTPSDTEIEIVTGGFSAAKRRMHSGGPNAGFAVPGTRYHRRAESAPVMTPIDYQSGLHKWGSNPQMADVFEEDEEEYSNSPDSKLRHKRGSHSEDERKLNGLGVQIVDVGIDADVPPTPRAPRPKRSVESSGNENNPDMEQGSSIDTEPSSVNTDAADVEECVVEIVDTTDEPRFSVITKSSDESTVTPTLSTHLSTGPLPSSFDFAASLSGPQFPTSETSSMNQSPDLASSYFEAPRLNTAHSSMTDRSMWSAARPADLGQEISYSTEDLPSLTSSASTMISGHPVPFTPNLGSRPPGDQRSLSFSGPVSRRTRPVSAGKRASFASLSRLVGSSHGEKSKLSIESRVQQDEEKPEKKKRNRLSRLMKFWKSKEDLRSY